ncbi:hypothetical protein [Corynebacterium diphtheriae]|uniref:hypothetical protein n=1 Tax=Corynebacterium diphtheriae TaxID=1717 RepID=UPI000DD04668|nr:hypothetical protein [Corynebacterium diphtheriae]
MRYGKVCRCKSGAGIRDPRHLKPDIHNHGLAGVGWRWWALVAPQVTPFAPEKDGTSHQICSNGRFGSDLV